MEELLLPKTPGVRAMGEQRHNELSPFLPSAERRQSYNASTHSTSSSAGDDASAAALHQAAETSKKKKQVTYVIVLNCLSAFAVNTLISVVSPFFPQYAVSHLGASDVLVGLCIAMFPLSSVFFGPVAGWASARCGYGAVAFVGALVLALGTLLFGIAPTITLATAARAVQGAGAAAVYIPMTSLLMATCAGDGELARALSLSELFTGIGYVLGPALGGVLYSIGGFMLTFASLAALPAAFALALPALLAAAGTPFRRLQPRAAVTAVTDVTADGGGVAEKAGLAPWVRALRPVLCSNGVLACCVCASLYSSVFGFLDATFERHLELALASPHILTGLMCSVPAATYSIGSLATFPAVRRYGYARCMAATWAVWGAAQLLLGYSVAFVFIPALPAMQEMLAEAEARGGGGSSGGGGGGRNVDAEALHAAAATSFNGFISIADKPKQQQQPTKVERKVTMERKVTRKKAKGSAASRNAAATAFSSAKSTGEVLGPILGSAAVAHLWRVDEVTCDGGGIAGACLSGYAWASTLLGAAILACTALIWATVPRHLGMAALPPPADAVAAAVAGDEENGSPHCVLD
ncbi:major facilitator superfamily domain-containing protein [Tribonema minus]|uniref:Major facilitator superfamily domain-containing protein n=1 Tax=Tribonema minus TaxID=303371 RepID=A0A835YVS3_9STRA|nr:major facilitator superfamily domain-containing protein [Tribonema minus]